jgi:hypothetical protein
MQWRLSHRADAEAVPLADRHYNRQKVGSPQFMPPGRAIVLKAGNPVGAYWGSSWPFAEYVRHAWPGAWICSAFRREDESLGNASDLIRDAVAATRWLAINGPDAESWKRGALPALGMVTFIDPNQVTPRKIRSRSTWGHSWFEAGWKHIGYTKAGLWTFQLLPADMPEPKMPVGGQMTLDAA